MFLLVSVRHVGAHPGEHQHGVSIQISINLGKTFLRISRIRNIPLTWNLTRVFAYLPPFISQILDFIYWTVLLFILVYFEWRDTENQQYVSGPRQLTCQSHSKVGDFRNRHTGRSVLQSSPGFLSGHYVRLGIWRCWIACHDQCSSGVNSPGPPSERWQNLLSQ